MLAKYTIDYTLFPQHSKRIQTHRTDDPVEAEDFLMYLLAGGARISGIHHDGARLDETQSDRMLNVAAGRLTARMLGQSLQLDSPAVKHRFGFAA